MEVSTIGPHFAYHISISITYKSYNFFENVALNRHFVNLFIADPVDYGINGHSVFADIELPYNAKNKWLLQLRCIPRKAHRQHFPGLWPGGLK